MTDAVPFVDQPVQQPVDLAALRSQVDSEIAARRVQDVASARLIERLGFKVGGVRLVLPTKSASELTEKPEIFRLPGAPTGVIGLANRHGRVVPTIDLTAVFGVGHQLQRNWLLVCGRGDDMVGILVDSPPETKRFAPEDAVEHMDSLSAAAPFGFTTYRDADGDWVDLDLTTVMAAIEAGNVLNVS